MVPANEKCCFSPGGHINCASKEVKKKDPDTGQGHRADHKELDPPEGILYGDPSLQETTMNDRDCSQKANSQGFLLQIRRLDMECK